MTFSSSTVIGFPLQFPIIRLRGFSQMTWSVETHQIFYGTKIFSFISRFFFSVHFISWRVFYLVSIQDFSSTNNYILNGVCIQEKKQLYIMITRPINHITSACNQLYDLEIWPINFILDIRLLGHICIITTSMSWPYPGLFIIVARIFNKPRNLA